MAEAEKTKQGGESGDIEPKEQAPVSLPDAPTEQQRDQWNRTFADTGDEGVGEATRNELREEFGIDDIVTESDILKIKLAREKILREMEAAEATKVRNLNRSNASVAASESQYNTMQIEYMYAADGAHRIEDGGHIPTFESDMSYRTQSFGYYHSAQREVTIRAGRVWFQGAIRIDVTESTVSLTGNPAYVFLMVNRSDLSWEYKVLASFPTPNATYFWQPLYHFVLRSDGNDYYLGDDFRFDIVQDLPLVAPS